MFIENDIIFDVHRLYIDLIRWMKNSRLPFFYYLFPYATALFCNAKYTFTIHSFYLTVPKEKYVNTEHL